MGEAELSEKEKIEKFIADTCKCKLAEQGAACSTILSRDDFYDSRNNCHELSSADLDLVIPWSNSKFFELWRRQLVRKNRKTARADKNGLLLPR